MPIGSREVLEVVESFQRGSMNLEGIKSFKKKDFGTNSFQKGSSGFVLALGLGLAVAVALALAFYFACIASEGAKI